MTTTTRILVAFLLLLGGAMWFLLNRIEQRVKRQYLEAAEEPMVDVAHLLASILEGQVNELGEIEVESFRQAIASGHQRAFAAQIYNLTKTSVNMHVYVTDGRGLVLFDSNGGAAEGENYATRRDVGLTLLGGYGARSTAADERNPGSSVMFVAAPVRHAGEIAGVVSVSKPQRSMYAFIAETRTWLRWIGWSFGGVVALGAVLMTILFARPIQRLTAYAREVARGERVTAPRFRSPELVTLAHAFEEMRDALEGRKYVEQYVQTMTHEMKSPVAAIRGAAELLQEEMPTDQRERFVGNIRAEADRLQKIIDRLLALAAIESRKALEQPKTVDLQKLAAGVCAQMQPAAEARGLRIDFSAEEAAEIVGEPFLLEIALTNLLQNAIEFSPGGSTIRVTLGTSTQAPAQIRMIVEDEGTGIPEYALPRIFERFYSLQHPATGRKSSGLGLCFVREALELHGGTVRVVNRLQGAGVRAELTLPAAA